MKKIISILVLISMLFSVFAASPKIQFENEKKTQGEIVNPDFRFLWGFGFQDMESSKHKESLEAIVNSEIDYVIEKDKENENNDDYVLVGHSQGGLRSLAYATMLERRINDETLTEQERADAKASYERLAGVITMSGIDKGLKAIENNFSTLKTKLYSAANILLNGLMAAYNLGWLTDFIAWVNNTSTGKYGIEQLISLLKDMLSVNGEIPYYLEGLNGPEYEEFAEIYDMVPNSDFIKKNVSDSNSITYKKQTGTKKNTRWEKVNSFWYWWVEYQEPVYEEYTVYIDKPKFSNDLPVGYIVGADNNTLGFFNSISNNESLKINPSKALSGWLALFGSIGNHDYEVNTEKGIRESFKHLAKEFNKTQTWYNVTSWCTVGISCLFGTAKSYSDACAARDWCNNIDEELNNFKGSSENDGLVAKESQYYPKYFFNSDLEMVEEVHTNVLGTESKGYREVDYNHINIDCPEVFKRYIEPLVSQAKESRK